jgi:hypothetical protein
MNLIERVKAIKSLIAKGDKVLDQAEQFYKQAGKHLKALQQDRSQAEWLKIVEEQCNLGKTRAYEMMRIAEGKTTLEEVRKDRGDRVRLRRTKRDELIKDLDKHVDRHVDKLLKDYKPKPRPQDEAPKFSDTSLAMTGLREMFKDYLPRLTDFSDVDPEKIEQLIVYANELLKILTAAPKRKFRVVQGERK